MPRPDTPQDVIELVRLSGAVDGARLAGFVELFRYAGSPPLPPEGVFGLMIERGLLTAYQAGELAAGRGDGLRVDRYLIRDRLGRGGMGQVFLAEHAVLGKRVAVKVLSTHLRADPDARARFVREARAAAAVDHPNVVRVYDADVAHDPPFLVMEYVDGVSLQAAVARHGAFAPAEADAVGVQVARGLGAAGDAGLVHRDIKPANLLIDRAGEVKILDLGLARFAADPTAQQTDRSVLLGTLDYLAPEQAVDSHAVDIRADIYALGATLYFLLAGHPPYPDDDLDRKLASKQSADPATLTGLRPDVPPGLDAVVHKLLARNPADRYRTPDEVAAALTPWVGAGPDVPARQFRPAALPDPGAANNRRRGRDPTPLPLTQRVVRSPGRPTVADRPALQTVAEPAPALLPLPIPVTGSDSGVPTARLFRESPVPARGSSARIPWWAIVAGALAAGLLAAGVARGG
jgi:serine/threonine protein kinase